jgi:carbon monoxide dehydrogenase subunit G
MKFEQTIELPGAPPERVWAFVMDVPSVAQCIPGCEGVEALGDDRYKAVVKLRVGPISLSLASEISIVDKDEAQKTAALRVEAADKRVGGAVKATMSMKLTPDGDGTRLEVSTDANVMGRIGDFGQPVIRKKADQTLQEVAQNLRKALAVPV